MDTEAKTRQRIEAVMKRKRSARSAVFDSRLPYSVVRILRSAFSYVLLLSDVPRAGIGVTTFPATSSVLEPDTFQSVGPWAYTVQRIRKNETTLTTSPPSAKVWSYKFDTTSIVWRAFAEFLEVGAFPSCVLYKSACPSAMLSKATVFAMIDSLPTALAQRHPGRLADGERESQVLEPTAVTLRTKSTFLDRIHHYVLPQLFVNPSQRTNQAFFYSPDLLEQADFQLCYPRNKSARPLFCGRKWANFQWSCLKSDSACRSVGTIATHVLQRLRTLQAEFPNLVVDLTILESAESVRQVRGGVCFVGRRDADVSTILRVRDCRATQPLEPTTNASIPDPCDTILVHDFRYEATVITSDVVQWFTVVASLRTIGQTYFFLRVTALFVSCYATRASEEKYERASRWSRCRAALLLFVRVPSQCVVHGSTFPILCYVCAHVIDAPFTYEMAGGHLITTNGRFTIGLWEFCGIAAVQMRSLWLLALFLQAFLAFLTLHRDPDWSPAHGVLGVPGLFVGVLSSWTIFGQFRALSLRNAAVLSVHELPRTSATPLTISHDVAPRLTPGNALLEGVYIDVKLLLCILVLTMVVSLLHYVVDKCVFATRTTAHGKKATRARRMSCWQLTPALTPGWTPVPYSAGPLWRISAVCTRWTGSVFNDPTRPPQVWTWRGFVSAVPSWSIVPHDPAPVTATADASVVTPTTALRERRRANIAAGVSSKPLRRASQFRRVRSATPWPTWPHTGRGHDTLQFLQFHLEHVHVRHAEVDAVVALFNLVAMSDPLAFVALRVLGAGKELAFYECVFSTSHPIGSLTDAAPDRIVLLPPAVAADCFAPNELKLLASTRSLDLSWSDLVHCG